MKLLFKDRFNRKYSADHTTLVIGYNQSKVKRHASFTRNKLPASFWIDGNIYWRNTKSDKHCTIGPAISCIYGEEMQFWLNDRQVTRMEVFLS